MTAISAAQSQFDAAQSGITVRKLGLDFGDNLREFWFDNNPFLTSLLTSLSVSFPAGERFFIDSVRHFQEQIKDPKLAAEIKAFIGQEAQHTKEHMALNRFMERKGYPALRMEQFVRDRMQSIQDTSTPEQNLARTVALEHFTAIMAKGFMDHPEFFEKMDSDMATIWAWHAIEEVEHKSVAFDVYKTCVDDERLRLTAMLKITYFFILINAIRTIKLLHHRKQLFNLKAWAKGLNLLWISPGVFRKIIPDYLEFYRKDFHPSQQSNSLFVEAIKRRYLGDKA